MFRADSPPSETISHGIERLVGAGDDLARHRCRRGDRHGAKAAAAAAVAQASAVVAYAPTQMNIAAANIVCLKKRARSPADAPKGRRTNNRRCDQGRRPILAVVSTAA